MVGLYYSPQFLLYTKYVSNENKTRFMSQLVVLHTVLSLIWIEVLIPLYSRGTVGFCLDKVLSNTEYRLYHQCDVGGRRSGCRGV